MLLATGLLATAYTPLPRPAVGRGVVGSSRPISPEFDPLGLNARAADAGSFSLPSSAVLGLAAVAASVPEAASAKGGEYGIFEGRLISLAHPTVMALMYGASAFAAVTGFQWRQLREIGGQVTELKAEQKTVAAEIEALEAKEAIVPAAHRERAAELAAKIDALSATRKELAGANLRDKHYQVGSVLLGLGTSFAIEGPVNTFMRANKLFPGPHLYAGAGVVVSWAMAASLVPLMAKGRRARGSRTSPSTCSRSASSPGRYRRGGRSRRRSSRTPSSRGDRAAADRPRVCVSRAVPSLHHGAVCSGRRQHHLQKSFIKRELAQLVHLDGECLDRRRRPRVRAVRVVEPEFIRMHSSEHVVRRPLALAAILARRRLELEVLLRQPQEEREFLGRAKSAAGLSGGGRLVSSVSARLAEAGGDASARRDLQCHVRRFSARLRGIVGLVACWRPGRARPRR